MRELKLHTITIIIILLICMPVKAQSTGEELAGVREHDGFYLRFHAGFGAGKMVEENILGSDLILQGLSSVFRFQIGGTISSNLMLFGEIGGFTIANPALEWQGISGTLSKTYLAITDFGIGVSYYFMPSNFYLSSTITLSSDEIEVEQPKIEGKSDTGLGVYLSVGKEWWVGSQWGLGVAIFGYFSNTKDTASNQEYAIRNTVLGIVFSATYH